MEGTCPGNEGHDLLGYGRPASAQAAAAPFASTPASAAVGTDANDPLLRQEFRRLRLQVDLLQHAEARRSLDLATAPRITLPQAAHNAAFRDRLEALRAADDEHVAAAPVASRSRSPAAKAEGADERPSTFARGTEADEHDDSEQRDPSPPPAHLGHHHPLGTRGRLPPLPPAPPMRMGSTPGAYAPDFGLLSAIPQPDQLQDGGVVGDSSERVAASRSHLAPATEADINSALGVLQVSAPDAPAAADAGSIFVPPVIDTVGHHHHAELRCAFRPAELQRLMEKPPPSTVRFDLRVMTLASDLRQYSRGSYRDWRSRLTELLGMAQINTLLMYVGKETHNGNVLVFDPEYYEPSSYARLFDSRLFSVARAAYDGPAAEEAIARATAVTPHSGHVFIEYLDHVLGRLTPARRQRLAIMPYRLALAGGDVLRFVNAALSLRSAMRRERLVPPDSFLLTTFLSQWRSFFRQNPASTGAVALWQRGIEHAVEEHGSNFDTFSRALVNYAVENSLYTPTGPRNPAVSGNAPLRDSRLTHKSAQRRKPLTAFVNSAVGIPADLLKSLCRFCTQKGFVKQWVGDSDKAGERTIVMVRRQYLHTLNDCRRRANPEWFCAVCGGAATKAAFRKYGDGFRGPYHSRTCPRRAARGDSAPPSRRKPPAPPPHRRNVNAASVAVANAEPYDVVGEGEQLHDFTDAGIGSEFSEMLAVVLCHVSASAVNPGTLQRAPQPKSSHSGLRSVRLWLDSGATMSIINEPALLRGDKFTIHKRLEPVDLAAFDGNNLARVDTEVPLRLTLSNATQIISQECHAMEDNRSWTRQPLPHPDLSLARWDHTLLFCGELAYSLLSVG
mgnify:CR=1 FL=1